MKSQKGKFFPSDGAPTYETPVVPLQRTTAPNPFADSKEAMGKLIPTPKGTPGESFDDPEESPESAAIESQEMNSGEKDSDSY